jgi:hypothetical protein
MAFERWWCTTGVSDFASSHLLLSAGGTMAMKLNGKDRFITY